MDEVEDINGFEYGDKLDMKKWVNAGVDCVIGTADLGKVYTNKIWKGGGVTTWF